MILLLQGTFVFYKHILFYIFSELLSSTVQSAPQILLESTQKIRETFDYLSFLSPTSADDLMRSIQPLLKISVSLRDALIIVLRKAMFSRYWNSSFALGIPGLIPSIPSPCAGPLMARFMMSSDAHVGVKTHNCPWYRCLAAGLNIVTGQSSYHYITEVSLNVTLNNNKPKWWYFAHGFNDLRRTVIIPAMCAYGLK